MRTTPEVVAPARGDRAYFLAIAVASAAALALLSWLILLRKGDASLDVDLRFMPAVNAGLNATAATLLTLGWLAIRQQRTALHRRLMVSAFAASALFLVGYLAYHYVHGDTKYVGPYRGAYLALLASHVLPRAHLALRQRDGRARLLRAPRVRARGPLSRRHSPQLLMPAISDEQLEMIVTSSGTAQDEPWRSAIQLRSAS